MDSQIEPGLLVYIHLCKRRKWKKTKQIGYVQETISLKLSKARLPLLG